MLYIICRNKDEILYDLPKNAKVIINTCPLNFFGEVIAWKQIYEDAKKNGYKTVGIYQARRAFHDNGKILSDFEMLDDKCCYVSKKYNLNSDTIYTQFDVCHEAYIGLLEKILPKDLLDVAKNTHYLYPHSMFYTSFTVFKRLLDFVFSFLDVCIKNRKNDDKIFSFVTERLVSLFLLTNEIHIHEVDCLSINKQSKHIEFIETGLAPWWRK